MAPSTFASTEYQEMKMQPSLERALRHRKLLKYLAVETGYVVVASNAGEPSHPAWLLNLGKDPKASIRVKKTSLSVVARELTGDERSALWSSIIAADDSYATYQARTSREIPLVHLGVVADSTTSQVSWFPKECKGGVMALSMSCTGDASRSQARRDTMRSTSHDAVIVLVV